MSRKLKVLHIIPSLEIGGMEQVVASLLLNLDTTRFDAKVVCIEGLGALAEELEQQGIQVMKVGRMLPIVSFIFPWPLIKIIKEYKADIVHVHSGCWYKAAAAGFWCGVKKVIYTEHGRWFPDRKIVMLLDRLYACITSHIVAVSRNLGEYMATVIQIKKEKIEVIINGIDEAKYVRAHLPARGETVTVGIIARLAAVKDIPTLLQAVKIVQESYPATRLMVAGDGPERRALEQLAVELRLGNSVSFLGFRRDIPDILKEMDIFVLSSLSEGTSVTLLEAMAAGKPVVVTRVGGNPDIVHEGENGLLVAPGKPDELAAAIRTLIADPGLRERMSRLNREKIKAMFSIKAMTMSYEKLYECVQ